jgi:hypothetical protein
LKFIDALSQVATSMMKNSGEEKVKSRSKSLLRSMLLNILRQLWKLRMLMIQQTIWGRTI